MALRTPLSVTPHLYMGDSTGRPLDNGVVYFGEQDKDPEFYPITLYSDDALTLPLMQPVHTKGGYLYDKGDMVEPHAKEIIYSVKVLDSYGRKVFYKGAMMRNSWNDDVIEQINQAVIGSADVARQVATDITNEAINNTAVEGGVLADTFVVVDGSLSQRTINKGLESIADLSTINNPKDGLRVYVKSYHAGLGSGGGYFTYDSSKASENDGGTVINGWVRETEGKSIKPSWFGVRTDGTDNPENPNHELLQVAVDAGFKSFNFGGNESKYLFNGQVGLKSQTFYSKSAYVFEATGAEVKVEGAYAWLTNIEFKNNGGIVPVGGGFTGKLFIRGFTFTGRNSKGVFDGDCLYNVIFTNNDCYQMDIITRSFQGRSGYPNGYFQSVSIVNNHFSSVKQIMLGNMGFNILVDGNTFENCTNGIYINGAGQPAINTIRIINNVFEAGGLLAYLGDTIGGTISGNYLESNNIGDALTEKCAIFISRNGGGYNVAITISDNMSQTVPSQQNDPDYVMVRFMGFSGEHKNVAVSGNWTNARLCNVASAVSFGNSYPGAKNLFRNPSEAGINYLNSVFTTPLDATNLNNGKVLLAKFKYTSLSFRAPVEIKLTAVCDFKTSVGGNISNACINCSVFIYAPGYSLGGGYTLQAAAGRLDVMQQKSTDTLANTEFTTSAPFSAPEVSVISAGDGVFEVWVGTFTRPVATNFGSSTEMRVALTAEVLTNSTNLVPQADIVEIYQD